ncbi:hypothetical protein GGF31_001272 [Allomyces arbusculus]|nr:hypothetical protein GGF31_001272 [Allomyces arbusculus]
MAATSTAMALAAALVPPLLLLLLVVPAGPHRTAQALPAPVPDPAPGILSASSLLASDGVVPRAAWRIDPPLHGPPRDPTTDPTATVWVAVSMVSDALIAFAYFAIPAQIFYFERHLQVDSLRGRLRAIVWLFEAFILAWCVLLVVDHAVSSADRIIDGSGVVRLGISGTTHLLKVWTTSDTPTLALTKAVTAIVSVVTSVALVQLMPMAMLLPGRLFLLEEELVVRAHNERVLQAENTNLTKLRAITMCVRRALEFHTICDIASVQLARHFDLVGCAVFALDANCPVPDGPATPAAVAAALATALRSAPPSPAISHCAWPCSPVPGHVPLADMPTAAPNTHLWAQHVALGPATCVALHHTSEYADLVASHAAAAAAAAAGSPRASSSSRGSSSRTSTGSAPRRIRAWTRFMQRRNSTEADEHPCPAPPPSAPWSAPATPVVSAPMRGAAVVTMRRRSPSAPTSTAGGGTTASAPGPGTARNDDMHSPPPLPHARDMTGSTAVSGDSLATSSTGASVLPPRTPLAVGARVDFAGVATLWGRFPQRVVLDQPAVAAVLGESAVPYATLVALRAQDRVVVVALFHRDRPVGDNIILHDALGQIEIALDQAVQIEYEAKRQAQMSVLEREKQEAEALNSTKTMFLATVSHELRTPMNAIIGLVDLLLTKYTLSRDMREVLEIVAVSSSTLLNLVNDLLDLSKLECQGNNFTLDHRPFSVLDVVEKSIEVVCTQAEAKGLHLCAHLDHEFNVVVGDKLRLRQVLVNLMSNAIKFTERGGVTLRVTTEEPSMFVDDGDGVSTDTSPKTPKTGTSRRSGSSRKRRQRILDYRHAADKDRTPTASHVRRLSLPAPPLPPPAPAMPSLSSDTLVPTHADTVPPPPAPPPFPPPPPARPATDHDGANVATILPKRSVYFQVRDTGIGIEQDKMHLLFEKFQQMDATISRRFHGTGLGLAITSRLVGLHQGRIVVDSVIGKGSVFTVELPFPVAYVAGADPPHGPAAATGVVPHAPPPPDPVPPAELLTPSSLVAEDGRHLPTTMAPEAASPVPRSPRVRHPTTTSTSTRIPVAVADTCEAERAAIAALLRRMGCHPVQVDSTEALCAFFDREAHEPGSEAPVIADAAVRVAAAVVEDRVAWSLDEPTRRALLDHKIPVLVTAHIQLASKERATDAALAAERARKCKVPFRFGLSKPIKLRALHRTLRDALSECYTQTELASAGCAMPALDPQDVFMCPEDAAEADDPAESAETAAAPGTTPVTAAGLDPARIQQLHVLVVDDNAINLVVAQRTLASIGITRIATAADGLLAVQYVDAHPDVDMILMDVSMPVMDGLEATRAILAKETRAPSGTEPHTPSPYICAMTASALPEERNVCLASGMHDFVPKPARRLDLVRVLERFVEWRDAFCPGVPVIVAPQPVGAHATGATHAALELPTPLEPIEEVASEAASVAAPVKDDGGEEKSNEGRGEENQEGGESGGVTNKGQG